MKAIITVVMIIGFLPTYSQSLMIDSAWVDRITLSDTSVFVSVDNAVTEDELLFALELADIYLRGVNMINNDLLYIDEPTRLRMMADEIEQKERDLDYIKKIRVRLALYGIKKESEL